MCVCVQVAQTGIQTARGGRGTVDGTKSGARNLSFHAFQPSQQRENETLRDENYTEPTLRTHGIYIHTRSSSNYTLHTQLRALPLTPSHLYMHTHSLHSPSKTSLTHSLPVSGSASTMDVIIVIKAASNGLCGARLHWPGALPLLLC